jgi:acyl carrier protein
MTTIDDKRTNLEKRVLDVVCEHFNWSPARDSIEVKLEHDVHEDLGADSLDMVEIVMALEEEFNLDIEDDKAVLWRSPQQAADYLYGRLYGKR